MLIVLDYPQHFMTLYEKGPVADSIVRKVQLTVGILSHADLENYTVHVERALEGTYRGKKVYTTHAPTSGSGNSLFYFTR